MEPHTVEVKHLQEWVTEKKVLFASSTREPKELYSTLRGSFEVWHKNELVLETNQALEACKKYNSL